MSVHRVTGASNRLSHPTSACESIESILFSSSSLVSGACSDVSGRRILGKQVWISHSRIRNRIQRSSGAVSGRFECRQAKCRSSGAAAPVFDAVVVGSEAVVDPPEDGLGSAADVDLAVDRPDVGLHGVGAEVGQPRPGQSRPTALRPRGGTSLMTTSPACTASSAATNSRAGSVFDR